MPLLAEEKWVFNQPRPERSIWERPSVRQFGTRILPGPMHMKGASDFLGDGLVKKVATGIGQ